MALPDSSSNTTIYASFPSFAVTQRANSAQATSGIVASSVFGATQAATLLEVANTLIALGFWKGQA